MAALRLPEAEREQRADRGEARQAGRRGAGAVAEERREEQPGQGELEAPRKVGVRLEERGVPGALQLRARGGSRRDAEVGGGERERAQGGAEQQRLLAVSPGVG